LWFLFSLSFSLSISHIMKTSNFRIGVFHMTSHFECQEKKHNNEHLVNARNGKSKSTLVITKGFGYLSYKLASINY
jgi:hypothetical protein